MRFIKLAKYKLIAFLPLLVLFPLLVACGSAGQEPGDEQVVVEAVDEDAVVTIGDRPELRAYTRAPAGNSK